MRGGFEQQPGHINTPLMGKDIPSLASAKHWLLEAVPSRPVPCTSSFQWCHVVSLKWAIPGKLNRLVSGGWRVSWGSGLSMLKLGKFQANWTKVVTISHGRSVYTIELGKSYRSEHCLLRDLLVKYAPARYYSGLVPQRCSFYLHGEYSTGPWSSPYSSSSDLRDCAAVIGRGEDLRSYPFSWKWKPLLGKLYSNNPSIMNHIDKALKNLKLSLASPPKFYVLFKINSLFLCHLLGWTTKIKVVPSGYI